jgi:Spy/CpxP family protein refolding chaperone
MRRLTSGVAILATVMALSPVSVDAQRGPRGPRGLGPGMRGQGVEAIMRLRERLGLSEDQIQQLDQIRQESVQRRTAHRAEMEELRSRVMAGQMEAAELRQLAQERQEAAQGTREAQRERVEAVLTDDQKAELENLRSEARAFQRGRRSVIRGRGVRGPRGGMGWGGPGMNGRGPRPGMRGRGRIGPDGQDPGAPGSEFDPAPLGPGIPGPGA